MKGEIKMTKLENTTLNVTLIVTRRLKIRIWFAVKLITLAALVLGAPLEIETNKK